MRSSISLGMRSAVADRARSMENMFMAANPALLISRSSCSGLPSPPVSLGKMICLDPQSRMTKAIKK